MKSALLIGCNYPNSNISLNGCINDVLNIKKLLISKYGFLNNEIIIMTDNLLPNNPFYPNAENIHTQIKKWTSNSNNSILNYFHYSGHGSSIKDRNSDELDGYDEFIVPSDYLQKRIVILDDTIYKYLENIKNTTPTFLSFDSCMSGTICDLNFSYLYDTKNKKFTSKLENKNTSLLQKNIVSLSAVRDTQYALDVTYNNLPVGAFTTALISCLTNLNFNVSMNTLISSIYVFLISNNYISMSPVMSANKEIDLSKTFFLSPILFQAPIITPIQPIVVPPKPVVQPVIQPVVVPPNPVVQPVVQPQNPYLSLIRTYIQTQYKSKRISKNELQNIIDSL